MTTQQAAATLRRQRTDRRERAVSLVGRVGRRRLACLHVGRGRFIAKQPAEAVVGPFAAGESAGSKCRGGRTRWLRRGAGRRSVERLVRVRPTGISPRVEGVTRGLGHGLLTLTREQRQSSNKKRTGGRKAEHGPALLPPMVDQASSRSTSISATVPRAATTCGRAWRRGQGPQRPAAVAGEEPEVPGGRGRHLGGELAARVEQAHVGAGDRARRRAARGPGSPLPW